MEGILLRETEFYDDYEWIHENDLFNKLPLSSIEGYSALFVQPRESDVRYGQNPVINQLFSAVCIHSFIHSMQILIIRLHYPEEEKVNPAHVREQRTLPQFPDFQNSCSMDPSEDDEATEIYSSVNEDTTLSLTPSRESSEILFIHHDKAVNVKIHDAFLTKEDDYDSDDAYSVQTRWRHLFAEQKKKKDTNSGRKRSFDSIPAFIKKNKGNNRALKAPEYPKTAHSFFRLQYEM